MKSRILCVALCLLAVSACSSLRPNFTQASSTTATDIAALVRLANDRAKAYRGQVERMEKYEWRYGETTLAGGIGGTLGAVAHSMPLAAVGALTAGTSTLLSTFYGTEKQNDAYIKAFGAASCVSSIAVGINFPTALTKITAPTGGGNAAEYALGLLNGSLDKIDGILFSRLRKRAVSSEPNFEQFQTHLQNSLQRKPAASVAGLNTLANGRQPLTASEDIDPAEFERLKTAIGRLQDDVGLCISAN